MPANYKVLFLQGGATTQFAMVPLNLLRPARSSTTSTPAPGRRRRSPRPSVSARSMSSPTRRRGKLHHRARRRPTWQRSAGCRLPALHAQRDHRRRGVPVRPDAATCRWSPTCPPPSCRGPIDVSRFGVIYAGRAEEHRPGRPDHRHRARGPARPGRAEHAHHVRLEDHGDGRLDVQHAAHLCLVSGGPGVPVDQAAGRARRRWADSTRPRRNAVCRHRCLASTATRSPPNAARG